MKHVLYFDTLAEAKAASNAEAKRQRPDATTELWWPLGKIGAEFVCLVPSGTEGAEETDADITDAEPFVLPVVVPASITRAQAKLALLGAGLLDGVQAAIDAITDPVQRTAAQIEWDDRLTFDRSNPTLNALAAAMGLSTEQLDALFIAAAQL